MNKYIEHDKRFFIMVIPMLVNILASRLVTQTDLVMVSSFGEIYSAAFAIPNSIMLLDFVLAFALIPVLTVRIGKASEENKQREIINGFKITTIFSIIVTIVCLLVYPMLVSCFVKNLEVQEISRYFIFILTFAIPFKFLQLYCSNLSYITKKNIYVLYISIYNVIANYLLNYLFMVELDFGAEGCYIGTIFSSASSVLFYMFILREQLGLKIFNTSTGLLLTLKDIWKNAIYESARVLSQRIVLILAIFFISLYGSTNQLQIYAIITELLSLIGVIPVVFFRGTIIHFSNEKLSKEFGYLKHLMIISIAIVLFITLPLSIFCKEIGTLLYNINLDIDKNYSWWITFFAFLIPIYLFDFLAYILKGFLQAKSLFNTVAKIEIIVSFLIFLPLFALGAYMKSELIFYGAYTISNFIIFAVLLTILIKKIKSGNLSNLS